MPLHPQWMDSGQIKRIRGVAYTSRVTPTVANRMLDAAKGMFLKFLTDVYITVDNAKTVSPGKERKREREFLDAVGITYNIK